MLADNSGSIELFMAANSLFTGKSETENSGIIDLDMTDSMWRMTGSSSLTNFTNNKSVVDMTKDGGAFSSLTTEISVVMAVILFWILMERPMSITAIVFM